VNPKADRAARTPQAILRQQRARVNGVGFSLSVLLHVPLFSGMNWVKGNRTFARVQQAHHPEHAADGQRPKNGTEDAGDHARNQGHAHQHQEHGGNKSRQRPERKVQDVSQEARLWPFVSRPSPPYKTDTVVALGYRANFCTRDTRSRLALRRSQIQLVQSRRRHARLDNRLILFSVRPPGSYATSAETDCAKREPILTIQLHRLINRTML
jgi:hypothetical protein